MQIAILAVGRLRPSFREACDDYLRRVGRWATVDVQEMREAGRARTAEVQRREEGRHLAAGLHPRAMVVALTRDGDPWSSREFARRLERWREAARPVAFLVGGASGLARDLCLQADHRWSLSTLTLPHELARVVLVEQIYRAGTILRNEPYHKGT